MLKEFYIGQYHIEQRGSQLVNFSFLDLVVFDMVLETCLLGVVSSDLLYLQFRLSFQIIKFVVLFQNLSVCILGHADENVNLMALFAHNLPT